MAIEIYKTETTNPDTVGTETYFVMVDTVSETPLRVIHGYTPHIPTTGYNRVMIGALPAWLQALVTLYCYNPNDLLIYQKV